jgi:hypothetical protein
VIKLADAHRLELKRLLRGYRKMLAVDTTSVLALGPDEYEPLDGEWAAILRHDRRTISRINFLLEVLG